MLFVEYAKCGTCRKAKKWLDAHGFEYEDRPIKEENPTEEELRAWSKLSGISPRKMFNTSGMLYREMGLKEKLASMPEDEMFALLATDGMLVKRPVLVSGNTVFFGFKENEWEGKLTR
ncbi:MAG: arsenate reductase family protein [Erysipelotrichales bacterium]|nr:arsenate reductase family protein [Erysipelotrichales bacterium]MBQ1386834.1 arsenate reductase family protein [Erysipelotrichales bacterium]MBQ2309126.1 arsenate reductase family protein [Erysipelotrichales bacterium]MBQ2478971.1 arsenate reductase family protein [Erysipelotrichales bacterium]MBQ4011862.1 arsenate reductase family protein [Erysipelotrichales bacterium]